MKPLVSVVIPAFNSGRFIIDTLKSVFEQTYNPLEVIVVDDGSDDGTSEIISKVFGDKVKVIKQKNSGPSIARNRGIVNSNGKYIALLDADDLWLPEKIASQVEIMEKHPDVGLLCGNMANFDEKGREAVTHFERRRKDKDYFGDRLFVKDAFRKLYDGNFVSTPTVMIRRELLGKTGLFNPGFRFSEDYLLWLRFARVSQVAYQKEAYTLRRKHTSNLTNDLGASVFIQPKFFAQVEKEHGDYLRNLGLDISHRYAQAFFLIGCFKLHQSGDSQVASNFLKSFRYRPNLRTAIYFLITAAGIGKLAIKLKRRLEKKASHNSFRLLFRVFSNFSIG